MKEKTYTSIAINLFDLWRCLIFGIPFFALAFYLFLGNYMFWLKISTLVFLIFSIIYCLNWYSKIGLYDKNLTIKTISEEINLKNVTRIESWWNFEIGITTYEIADYSGNMKQRQHINRNFIYVTFYTNDNCYSIYEEIYMSDKGTGVHPYNESRKIDLEKSTRVWDVDKCLKKLGLEEIVNQ